MNKTRIYLLVVMAIMLLIGLISLNKGKTGINPLNAYTSACDSIYGPLVVSAMDDNLVACSTSGPPTDAFNDITAWKAVGIAFPTPVVSAMSLVSPDPKSPTTGTLGSNYMRVQWTDAKQRIILPETMFEDQGCGGVRNDWSCYDYVGFNFYLNYFQDFAPVPEVPQTISFYDGVFSITTTANPVKGTLDDGLGAAPHPWKQHASVSLKWLANQYNPATGTYFNVANIQSMTINAPNVDYTYFSSSGFILYEYYDALMLGDGLTEYASPPNITITTVNTSIHGAYVSWDHFDDVNIVNNVTPTAYELYRSINMGSTTGPYELVSGNPVAYNASLPGWLTDTACPGGGVFCYKILTCSFGPNGNTFTAMANTVNASYHEDLLANIPAVCGWVDLVPSPIPTPTNTIVCPVGGCPTPLGTNTITPTVTPTPFPTSTPDITNAHVYPNPFNPNDGSKTFYVNNVLIGTNVYIYSMDGSLVVQGALTNGNAHYQIVGGFPTFVWDGKNRNGTRVVSGLYYLVLEDPNKKTRVLRIIVCYKCKPVYGEP